MKPRVTFGIANYSVQDSNLYDYTVSGLNEYYRAILTLANKVGPAAFAGCIARPIGMDNENPPRCIIFDLSEVFIAGLPGVEKRISTALSIPEDGLLECFGGEPVMQVLRGEISEDSYLGGILERTGWDLALPSLKRMLRDNFHVRIDGSLEILREVVKTHHVALLSDHVREWVPYIRSIHPFLDIFDDRFYSFELGKTKSDPTVFPVVLCAMGYQPQECLFIDDRIRNVRSAESIGLPSIHFRNSRQLRTDLRRRRVLR